MATNFAAQSAPNANASREEARWVSQGKGIRSINYVINDAAFETLIKALKEQHETEQQAIRETSAILKERGEKTVNYHGKERYTSHAILMAERELAEKEERPPRLGPWEVFITLNDYGLPSLRESKTCKTGVLKWLKHAGICDAETSRYGTGHSKGAFPRFFHWFNYNGDDPSQMRLHAIGGKLSHESKRTGKVTIFNEWAPTFGEYDRAFSFESTKASKKARTKIYWTIPPQALKLSTTTKDCDLGSLASFYQIYPKYLKQISTLTRSFQDLSEFFIQRSPNDFAQYDPQSFSLLNRILSHYIQEAFTYPSRNQDESYLIKTIAQGDAILRAIANGLSSEDGLCELPNSKGEVSTIHLNLNSKEKQQATRLLPKALQPAIQATASRGCTVM